MIFAVGQHIPRKARCIAPRTWRNPGVPRIPGSGRSGSRRRKGRLWIRCSFCLLRDRHGGAPGCVSRLRFRSPATYESPRRPAGALATVPADSEVRVALRNPRARIVASLFEELAGLEAFIGLGRLRHAAGHPESRHRNHHDSHAMHHRRSFPCEGLDHACCEASARRITRVPPQGSSGGALGQHCSAGGTTSLVGKNPFSLALACTDDEAWRRIEHRNRNLNGDLFISRETFEWLKARFVPLSDDEQRIEVPVDPSPSISGRRYRIAQAKGLLRALRRRLIASHRHYAVYGQASSEGGGIALELRWSCHGSTDSWGLRSRCSWLCP